MKASIGETMCISIHTPAKGVTFCRLLHRGWLCDFNPHSREGSDADACKQIIGDMISINTPAKGVTAIRERQGLRF